MVFINRHAATVLKRLEKSFPIILVTGPRQVGKTTLLKETIQHAKEYVTFDNPIETLAIKEDPQTFLNIHPCPVILDEVQYASALFPYLKMRADQEKSKGMYYLTGSQQFHMMKSVSESLAGRVGILHLQGISLRERLGDDFESAFLPIMGFLMERKSGAKSPGNKEIWEIIQNGSFPAVVSKEVLWQDFYASYLKTYIERDVRALTQVADEMQFLQFITVVANRTAQLLNYADIAKEVAISEVTAKKWLSILVTSGLVYLLQPYWANVEKRVIKTSKLYFLDTGLACFLTRWNTPETLMNGAFSGAIFETFVVGEILKSYYNQGTDPKMYFYRDKDGIEIDLLIEENGTLYPLEIKKTATPKVEQIKAFDILDRIKNVTIGSGGLISFTNDLSVLKKNVYAIPVRFL